MQTLYHYSIAAGAVVTAVLSLCLMLVKPPEREEYSTYRRSKIMLGMGYAVFSAGISVFVFFPIRALSPELCPVVNLTYYFVAAHLFGYSFIVLLSPGYYSRRRTRRFVAVCLSYVALLWTLALLTDGAGRRIVSLVFGLLFIIQAVFLIRVFLSSYSRMRRQLDDFYADTTALFIRWLNSSAWCIIVWGILCGVFTFLPPQYVSLLMLSGIAVFIYIYVSMQNYAFHLLPVQFVADNPINDALPAKDSGEPAPVFTGRLERWIAARGYCDDKVTLSQLAEEVGTNRSYLSNHINISYGKNFSEWINGMRIGYARQLMAGDGDMPLEEVAHKCGFSSPSYFSRIFKAVEGIPPSVWRQDRQ